MAVEDRKNPCMGRVSGAADQDIEKILNVRIEDDKIANQRHYRRRPDEG
ncbi:MAG: hypothetical protein IPK75_19780 [Acidobacteria bacterium]|nr:hypothetical protein [Acidobacteriota bacterium]